MLDDSENHPARVGRAQLFHWIIFYFEWSQDVGLIANELRGGYGESELLLEGL